MIIQTRVFNCENFSCQKLGIFNGWELKMLIAKNNNHLKKKQSHKFMY